MKTNCLFLGLLLLLATGCCVQPCQRTYILAEEMIKEKAEMITTCSLDAPSSP